jgi:anaerobic selenocysteine-containing dehydrogenase
MSRTQTVDPSVSRTPIALDGENQPTICVLCSHNCGIVVDVADGKITAVRADEKNPITEGYICNKGFSIGKYVAHDNRVLHPLKRRADGSFERIGWDQAIGEIGAKLAAIRAAHSARAIGLVGIGGQGNHMDAAYGLGFLRSLGSKRWYNAFAQEKTQHALIGQWMFNSSPATFMHADAEHTNYMLVMGTNPKISNRGHNATDLFKDLAKKHDCAVVVADPRETETTQTADRHLRVRPGTDVYMLLGMAATIVSRELVDYAFVQNRTLQYEELRAVLSQVDVDEMAKRCGLETAALVDAATELAAADSASIFYDLGVEQTPFSTLVSYAIHMILSITGNIGTQGGNVFMETFAPAQLDESKVSEPEVALASGIEAIRALGNLGMFSPTLVPEEIMLDHPERMRAMIVEGSNPILSFSDANAWREARKRLDLMVVIDPAMTDTARLADYVLPTPVGYEKWEIALFPKRYPEIHTQLRPPVVPGPSEALPEPEIYVRLAEAMDLFGPPPAQLEELAAHALEPEGAMTFLGTAQQLAQEAGGGENHMLFWAYRTLGKHLPAPSLVGIWFQCNLNALQRSADVLRTLGAEWQDKNPFEIGAELFRRVLAHPEGVEIARMDPDKNYEQHVNWDDKRIRLAPEKMLDEMRRAIATPAAHDPEYPFVLGSGLRTRWTANTIQQDPSWRKGRGPHCTLNLSEADAVNIGVKTGDRIRVSTRRGELTLPAHVDRKMMDGHVSMPNGFGGAYPGDTNGNLLREGANMNEITDVADRDPFTGCPHHRYVQVKLERLEA